MSSPARRSSVHAALEGAEGDLADHRIEHVLDLAREHDAAARRIALGLEERAEGQLLAEDRGGLRQRQRSLRQQQALPAREHLMNPVAELVGQDHHVPRLSLIVEQQVGMGARHGGVGEGAGRLAAAHRRVDPVVVEEAPGAGRELRREGAVGR